MRDRNESRPGYKKTKVGWVPKEWEVHDVKSTGDVITGATPPTSDSECFEGSFPFVTPADMGYSPWIKTSSSMLSEKGVSYARRLPKGAVLFVCIGASIGKVGIANTELTTNQQINAIIPNGKAHNMFLYYSLLNRSKQIASLAGCQTLPIINKSEFETILLPLPSPQEQMKIAEILSTWDDAIQQTRKLIDAKKRLKKGLMQQLLTGKKRLPVYEKQNNRVPYRFFDLPEDWECPQIKDIAIECSERNRNGDDLPVLACSKYTGFVQSSEYFGKRVFSENTTNYKIIRRGQFGFPSNHIEEGSIGLLRKPDKGLVSPIYTVFQCNEKVIPEYLYAVLKTDTFRHIFKTATNASVDRRGSLRWKEFSLIHVPLPARREQKAIADALATLDEDISLHEKKLNALEKQKRGLMQKLLTGEIRVIV
jgi:type I restriction enzyme S subunit